MSDVDTAHPRAQRAQVLVFASQKGGSGKTTVSAHMAVEAERSGAGPVALIDTDPQGSMAKWWNARASETPAFAQVSVPDLARDIDFLDRAGYRLIVIDTPPAVTSTIAEVITHADLVVLPTRPSPHDLRAVGPTVDIVQMQGKPLVFVVNSATARARITGETAIALSQHGTVAPVTLHHRVDFAASMIDGRTVGEVNESGRSASETASLWAYLEDRLARMRGDALELMNRPPRRTFEDDILTPASAGMSGSDGDCDDGPVPIEDRPGYALPGRTPRFGDSAMPEASNSNWDGVERRKADLGPPRGQPDRRRAGQPFGRRHLV